MKQHVLLVGEGIAGPALGLLMDVAGISSAIYEAYPQVDDLGGGTQVALNGEQVPAQIGIAGQLS